MEKAINVVLKMETEKVVLLFEVESEPLKINIENDDSDEIKKVFLGLAKELKQGPIKLEYRTDPSVTEKDNKLFIDSSIEYVEQLNNELKQLENDLYIKSIREFTSKKGN